MKDPPSPPEKPRRGAPIIDRIMWKIVRRRGKLSTPCWLWTGSCSTGYGQLSVSTSGKRRMIYVHRWLYEHHIGPIPPGYVLHHECEAPHCVNPAHLAPMTQGGNVRHFTNKKSHCPHGHLLSGHNLYITPRGTRACRECNRRAQRRLGGIARSREDWGSFKDKRLPRGSPVLDRIKAKIMEQPGPLKSPCWIWMGSLSGPGYAQIRITEDRRSWRVLVHRWMYEHHFGAPPPGADVHHKCDRPRCVNPAHLDAVTHRENIRKTTNQRTHCKHGHPLSGDNVRLASDGRRCCRACSYRRVRRNTKRRDVARKTALRPHHEE